MTLPEKLSLAAVIILTFIIAYTWSLPGPDIQTKWSRSYRRLKKAAQLVLLEKLKSSSSLSPMLRDVLSLVHIIVKCLPS
ncbi:unnamed protein product [Acanthoscelides obtectus]|uniref:Uncharacterized protein n=1 Tax=Acanthoscelides obtectus TaxID=200917 RepID=A0A9P0JHF7_ACAOB|nr:unnamed protein product [Acanthoscelides obtectus]CAK1678819.1 hypothetical protein AOBTE_LOCUS32032 [Acanthoscelides obtectus]